VLVGPVLRTERLLLRRWRPEDRGPFAALNADPVTMEYFPAPLSTEESDAAADRIAEGFERNGWGLWAVEVPGLAAFAGFCGLAVPAFQARFTPCVEVGWRLDRSMWGRGFAPEAATACLRFAHEELGLAEVVSFTAAQNHRSRRVMEKIGMTHDPGEDFDHPSLPPGHALERHVLYRVAPAALASRR
jgi:RimJ/RimL family protein N-acetyltransferase